jgi:hypothetical protein
LSIGDIFDGYTTFFNTVTIDNVAGTIVNIYGLIVGAGNVSDAGNFVNISFTAKSMSGVSQLHLYNVGVCDENGYLSTILADGSVTINGTSNPSYNPPLSSPGNDDITLSPPLSPINVSGPTFVEMGLEYVYTLCTTDPEGDSIRYRIDWGDGFMSDWSGFVASGSSVLFSHSWSIAGTYSLKVFAEDIYSFNTSWNYVFDVVVSGVENNTSVFPVGYFNLSGDITTNKTLFFDASGSFDIDGVIVSYFWDFGDGTNGSGKNVTHVYFQPGTYIITLWVIDNSGNINTRTITRIIQGYVPIIEPKGRQMFYEFNFLYVFVGIVILVLVCLVVIFRNRIYLFVLDYQINSMSNSLQNSIKHVKKFK